MRATSKHDPGVGIIYVDPELKPTPPSARTLLDAGRARRPRSPIMSRTMGWMNPIYGKLRLALASRLYRNERERAAARAQPRAGARACRRAMAATSSSIAPAARLYMYENGQVVDSMRVVAGRPDPIAQTPMMNAFIRYVALNPYWNSPPDITAEETCADHPQGGPRLFQEAGLRSLVGLVRSCRT